MFNSISLKSRITFFSKHIIRQNIELAARIVLKPKSFEVIETFFMIVIPEDKKCCIPRENWKFYFQIPHLPRDSLHSSCVCWLYKRIFSCFWQKKKIEKYFFRWFSFCSFVSLTQNFNKIAIKGFLHLSFEVQWTI